MITLGNDQISMEMYLGGTVTTNELDWSVQYTQEYFSMGIVAEAMNTGTSNGTTDVTMVEAPVAGARRHIRTVNVYNKDTASATVTIQINITTADRVIMKHTLAAGETLHYENNQGWYVT